MQHILDTSMSFFDLHDIQINASKTVVMALNTTDDNNPPLHFGNPPIDLHPIPKSTATRILGVWVAMDGNNKMTKQLVSEEVKMVSSTITKKAVTDRQAVYLINNVLLPKINYRLADLLGANAPSFFRLLYNIFPIAMRERVGTC